VIDAVGMRLFLGEILWLKLNQSKVFERRRGVLRVFVGYRGNTKFPQPIQQ
jgi:hypothetical protein